MLRNLFLLLLALGLTLPARAQVRVEVLSGSTLWIDGSSSVNRFTCEADAVDGQGWLRPPDQTTGSLEVAVDSFDCGKRRMNQDFTEALQGSEHPMIRFELEQATQQGPRTEHDTLQLQAVGHLTLAGITRRVEVEATAESRPDGTYIVEGAVPLQMTDFNIDPPSALLGLIQAHDDIVVRFVLEAARLSFNASN